MAMATLPYILICVCALLHVACSQDHYCTDVRNESPSRFMCRNNSIQGAEDETLYLDSLGAPNFQSVECDCTLSFNFTTTITVTYRSTGFEDDCGIMFSVSGFTWSCEATATSEFVSAQQNNLTFVKTRDNIGDTPGCIGFTPAAGGSLNIQCYQSREYVATTTPSANATTTPSTTTVDSTEASEQSTSGSTTTTTATTTVSGTTRSETSPVSSSPTTVVTTAQTTGPNIGASGDDEGSNTGAIAGGVVGGVLGLALVIVLIVCLVCFARKKTSKRKIKKDSIISHGPRSVRYTSTGDDVTITENRLYEGGGETPAETVNALFVGGIPLTTDTSAAGLPDISHAQADGRYTDMPGSQKENGSTVNKDTDHVMSDVTVKDYYSEVNNGTENAGYEEPETKTHMYREPYDEIKHSDDRADGDGSQSNPAPGGSRHTSDSASASDDPYDYIEHGKLETLTD